MAVMRWNGVSGAASSAVIAIVVVVALNGCGSDHSSGASVGRGAGVYSKNCASCHGPYGRSPLAMVPPLIGSERIMGPSLPLIAILLDGLKSPGEADDSHYRGVMPAWRDVLDDAQIADVLNYLRSESGEDGDDVLPSAVSEFRQVTEHRHAFWTPDELRRVERFGPTAGRLKEVAAKKGRRLE